MSMKHLFLTLSAIVVLSTGCASAKWVSRQQSPYRGGAIQYLDAGMDSIIAGRRDDAWEKMTEFCGGSDKFTVFKETKDGVNYMSYQGAFGMTNTMAMASDDLTLYFRCEAKQQQAAAN